MSNLLQELAAIDEELQKASPYPSLLIKNQNKKIKWILSNLIEVENGCKILPIELKDKFKTIGYYGNRETLPRVLYYFHNSLEDTVEFEMPKSNIYRQCSNLQCLNPLHFGEGKPQKLKILSPLQHKREAAKVYAESVNQAVAETMFPNRREEETEQEMEERLEREALEIINSLDSK